mmetsp:Transcript_100205/g.158544  ORF Transcript_100205/g.158544 Transcript_100205/m.158544 type:complete len:221 (-) Transcript_100205:74-736(-)
MPILSRVSEESALTRGGPAWMSYPNGEAYCNLCYAYCTDGHAQSNKHQMRLQQYNKNASGNIRHPPVRWGDPAHYEWQDGGWRCKLCEKWSDGKHVQSLKHLRNIDWASQWPQRSDASIVDRRQHHLVARHQQVPLSESGVKGEHRVGNTYVFTDPGTGEIWFWDSIRETRDENWREYQDAHGKSWWWNRETNDSYIPGCEDSDLERSDYRCTLSQKTFL